MCNLKKGEIMNFMKIGSVIDHYVIKLRLDRGKRPWRQVYLTTRWENQEQIKYVMVVYDYELTREAGKFEDKCFCPPEVSNKDFFDGIDDEDIVERRWAESCERLIDGRLFWYVTYKYAKGISLDKLMKRKKRPNFESNFMIDLCEAVNSVSIITFGGGHNAVSPENIIVENLGGGKYKPYLIGYADVWGPTKRKKICDVELLDHRFRAPETFVGGFSKYSDIYSLGVMLCYMFGGDAIWDYTLDDLRTMNEKQRRRAVLKMRKTALDRVVFPDNKYFKIARKALEIKPKNRFESLDMMKGYFVCTEEQIAELEMMRENEAIDELIRELEAIPIEDPVCAEKSDEFDFDKLLDDFIEDQLMDTTKKLADEALNEFSDDNVDDDDDSDSGNCFTDFTKNDDGSASVNVSIRKCKGVGFVDVAGMNELKLTLKRNFIDIIKHKSKAKMYNIQPSNGILLYGPPGCGKTFIAEKIAEEADLNFVMVKPSDLGSTYVHGSQTKIADLFKKAEAKAPALLCFDEFDAMVPTRDDDMSHTYMTEVNEFLVQLNNCASRGVYVLAMTNNIDRIDGAMLRKGRIDEVIYVPLPDEDARREMFNLGLSKCEMATDDYDFERLVSLSRGFTSSDITHIVLQASREAFYRSLDTDDLVNVTQDDLEGVIKHTSPSVSEADLRKYEKKRDEFINKKKQIDIRPRIGFAV